MDKAALRKLVRRVPALSLAVAVVGALVLVSPSRASAMSFEFTTEAPGCETRVCLIAKGAIDGDSARDLKTLARQSGLRPGALVILDSPGGDTLGGVALGAQIRNLGLDTRVAQIHDRSSGVCASACAYAFLGGLSRDIADGSKLGVHQMASAPDGPSLSASDAQWATALIALHVNRMGADVSFLTAALRTPPQRLHWFSREELASVRAVTDARETGRAQVTLERRPTGAYTSVSTAP